MTGILRTLVTQVPRFLSGLRIDGIEVTQGIQYYHSSQHLTNPAVQGADNAMTLVAGKPAWVRVYVRSGLLDGDVPDVTGSLEIRRRRGGLVYSTIATLMPQPPGSVTAHSDLAYAVERGTLGASLNFVVSSDEMCGALLLRANVRSDRFSTEGEDLYLDVTLQQTLRLRGVMVGYSGPASSAPNAPSLTLSPPTISALQSTSQWTLLIFPVTSAASYSSAGSITLTVPLTDARSAPGACTPNWTTLLNQVTAQITNDGNRGDVLYYGLLASGTPIGQVPGCENSSGTAAGSVGDVTTMAHELGHRCGFVHAPCGNVGTPDPAYPAYPPYDPANTPKASIGEYGLDISNGSIKSPAQYKDVMSYCGPPWISLYNYGRLLNNTALFPWRTCVDLPLGPPNHVHEVEPQPFISIIGVMSSEDELEVTSVMRVDTRQSAQGVENSDVIAELVGADGERIAKAPVRLLRAQAVGCGCDGQASQEMPFPCVVQAFIPDVARGAALAIRRGDKELWSVRAPAKRPRISSLTAQHTDSGLAVAWSVQSEAQQPELWLQWSPDRGRTWQSLAVGLVGSETVVDASHLPGGNIVLRLLAGDGFQTTVSRAVRVTLPEPLPAASILTPGQGEMLIADRTMRAWGAITHPDGDVKVRWVLDGEAVAESLDTVIVAPPPGEHRIELHVSVGAQSTRATATFSTVDPLTIESSDFRVM